MTIDWWPRAHCVALSATVLAFSTIRAQGQASNYEFNDSHFHLTNYIQEGTDIREFLKIMGDRTGRVALFGIPLQQQWSTRVDGDRLYVSQRDNRCIIELDETGTVLRTIPVPRQITGMVVVAGRFYLVTTESREVDDYRLLCLDARTGHLVQRMNFPGFPRAHARPAAPGCLAVCLSLASGPGTSPPGIPRSGGGESAARDAPPHPSTGR